MDCFHWYIEHSYDFCCFVHVDVSGATTKWIWETWKRISAIWRRSPGSIRRLFASKMSIRWSRINRNLYLSIRKEQWLRILRDSCWLPHHFLSFHVCIPPLNKTVRLELNTRYVADASRSSLQQVQEHVERQPTLLTCNGPSHEWCQRSEAKRSLQYWRSYDDHNEGFEYEDCMARE